MSLDSFSTRPTWTRRTRWSALRPSCGRLTITIITYLMALEIWSSMSCACQPSNFKREGKRGALVLMCNIHSFMKLKNKGFSRSIDGFSCVVILLCRQLCLCVARDKGSIRRHQGGLLIIMYLLALDRLGF